MKNIYNISYLYIYNQEFFFPLRKYLFYCLFAASQAALENKTRSLLSSKQEKEQYFNYPKKKGQDTRNVGPFK